MVVEILVIFTRKGSEKLTISKQNEGFRVERAVLSNRVNPAGARVLRAVTISLFELEQGTDIECRVKRKATKRARNLFICCFLF